MTAAFDSRFFFFQVRNFSKFDNITNFSAGGASSTFSLAPTKTLNDAGDITADHRDVPAKFVMKQCCGWFSFFVFQSCCFELSTFFRCMSDSISMLLRFTFDQVSTHVRFNFDQVSMHVRFISNHNSHDLHFDELQVGLRRTMLKFPCYVNRGL